MTAGALKVFTLYSKGCEYAIRALAEISSDKARDKFLARDICRKAGIPESYARKTFQALVQKGFLKAVPGPGGGYSLTRKPKDTTILDVIYAVEGKKSFSDCVLGLSACDDKNPCALHSLWLTLKSGMIEALGSRTLSELSEVIQRRAKKQKKRDSHARSK